MALPSQSEFQRAQYGATTTINLSTTGSDPLDPPLSPGMYVVQANVRWHMKHIGADESVATIGDMPLAADLPVFVYVSGPTSAHISGILTSGTGKAYVTALVK
jgi:hypothetical protein